jgi:hypothetical protein
VREHRPALAGHTVFEVFSVLTRMPGHATIDPPTAGELIRRVFPNRVWLGDDAAGSLADRLGTLGIVGGAVYHALVGETARVHNRTLLTRDLRARRTYDLLGPRDSFVGVRIRRNVEVWGSAQTYSRFVRFRKSLHRRACQRRTTLGAIRRLIVAPTVRSTW